MLCVGSATVWICGGFPGCLSYSTANFWGVFYRVQDFVLHFVHEEKDLMLYGEHFFIFITRCLKQNKKKLQVSSVLSFPAFLIPSLHLRLHHPPLRCLLSLHYLQMIVLAKWFCRGESVRLHNRKDEKVMVLKCNCESRSVFPFLPMHPSD